MFKTLKKAIAALMVTVMLLTSIPLQGFVDFEMPQWFSFEAEAAEEKAVSEAVEETVKAEPERKEVPLGEIVDGIQTVAPEEADKNIVMSFDEKKLEEFFIEVQNEIEPIVLTAEASAIADESDISAIIDEVTDGDNTESAEDEEALPDDSGKVNETVFWTFDGETRTLTVSGEGEIPSYYPEFYYKMQETPEEEYLSLLAPWESYLTVIEKLVIGDGITAIGSYNFLTAINLEEIDFGETLKAFGDACFGYVNRVEVLRFPSSLETIGESCFMFPFELKELYLNEGLLSMGDGCFSEGLISLKKAYIPSTLEQEDLTISVLGDAEITFNCKQEIDFEFSRISSISEDTESTKESIELYMFLAALLTKYYYGFYNDFIPMSDIGEDFVYAFIDEWNRKFDTKITEDDVEYTYTYIMLMIYFFMEAELPFQQCADENLIVNVAEDSAMHGVCCEKIVKHTVGNSAELCECFTFEGTVSDTISYSVDTQTRTLTISGRGDHPDNGSKPYYTHLNDYVDYVVFSEDSDITDIGSNAFEGMDIKEVTIPASVKIVRNSAFKSCIKLEAVNIIADNTGIALWPESFANCASLKEIYLPEGVYWLSDNAFQNSGLEKITIRNKNTQIGDTGLSSTIPYSAVIYCYSDSTAEAFAAANYRTVKYLDEFTVDMLEFDIGTKDGYDGEVATVIGYTGKAASVDIPAEYNGVPVVAIGSQAFYNNKYVETVNMPDSITEIGNYAFYYTNIETLRLSKNIKAIGNNAFYSGYQSGIKNVYASDLEAWLSIDFYSANSNPACYSENLYFGDEPVRDIVIPEGITKINDNAFYGYKGLTDVTFPSTLTEIGDYAFAQTMIAKAVIPSSITTMSYAFYGCEALETVIFENGIKTIAEYAFYNCSALKNVTVPASVESIGYSAFYNCTSLENIYASDLESWLNMNFDYGSSNPLGYAENLYFGDELVRELVIPEGITKINDNAFYGYKGLTDVTFPSTLTEIGDYAFAQTMIAKAVIPSSITTMSYAFYGCKALETVIFAEGVTTIPQYAFYNCTALKNVTISSSVDYIGYGAFYNCNELENIYAPDLESWLGISFYSNYYGYSDSNPLNYAENLFFGGELVKDLVIPEGITEISNDAFCGYKGLTSVTLPSTLTRIGSYAFAQTSLTEVVIPKAVYSMKHAFYNCQTLETVIIEDGVETISEEAFYYCTALKNITIPSSVNRIYELAFYSCESLKNVYASDMESWMKIDFYDRSSNPLNYAENLYFGEELVNELVIPEDITQIEAFAFYGYKGLTSVTFPATMTYIGACAFGSTALEKVVFSGESLELEISNNAFEKCKSIEKVYADSLDAYLDIEFYSGGATNPMNGGADLYIAGKRLTDLVITEETPEIHDYAFSGCTSLETVKFTGGMTVVPGECFSNCTALESVELCEGIETIKWSAFFNCSSLESIYIPDTVKTIEASAFNDCYALEEINLSSSLEYIGEYAFCDALKVKKYSLPEALTYIGQGAFWNNANLREINIPNGVTELNWSTFRDCTKLHTVTLPSALTSIDDEVFSGCSSLESIDIPDTVTYIGSYQFYNCTSLRSAKLSNGIEYIENYLFYNCSSLVSIEIPANVTYIYSYAFSDCTSLRNAFIDYTVEYIYYNAFGGCPNLTIYGVPGSYAETYANENSIPFEVFSTGVVINLVNENGETVPDGFTVNWYDSEANLIATGMNIKNVTPEASYSYEIVLDRELAYVYKPFDRVSFVATNDIEVKTHNLVKLSAAEFKGTVTDADGNVCENACVEITQTFSNRYTKTGYTYTDAKGEYSFSGLQAPTSFIFSKEGYYDRRKSVYSPEENGVTDVSVSFVKIPENKITLNLSLASATGEGEQANVSKLTNFNGLDFEIYNETREKSVYDFAIQYPYLILAENEADGRDQITVSVTDRNKKMTAEPTTIKLDENRMGSADIEFLENGKIKASVAGADEKLVLLFDENSRCISKQSLNAMSYTSASLSAKTYTLVFIEKSDLLFGITKLSQLNEMGLNSADYVKKSVTVADGVITDIGAVNVPDFDETKLSYTVPESTGIYTNGGISTVGKYIVVKAEYEIDNKYAADNQTITVDFPEGLDYAEGTLTVNSKLTPCTYTDNKLTVVTNKEKATLRFYCMASKASVYDLSAVLSFNNGGENAIQPIGSAAIEVEDARISVSEKTSNKDVIVRGTALPSSEIEVYVNDTLSATAKSNKVGSWATTVTLTNTNNYSLHNIYAKISNRGYEYLTDTASVMYDKLYLDVSKITMIFGSKEVEIDYRDEYINVDAFTYASSYHDFTFKVEFDGENPEKAENVYIVYKDLVGLVHNVPLVFDSYKGIWIGNVEINSSNEVPSGVGVVYDSPIAIGELPYLDAEGLEQEIETYGKLSEVFEDYITEYVEYDDFKKTDSGYKTEIMLDGNAVADYSIEEVDYSTINLDEIEEKYGYCVAENNQGEQIISYTVSTENGLEEYYIIPEKQSCIRTVLAYKEEMAVALSLAAEENVGEGDIGGEIVDALTEINDIMRANNKTYDKLWGRAEKIVDTIVTAAEFQNWLKQIDQAQQMIDSNIDSVIATVKAGCLTESQKAAYLSALNTLKEQAKNYKKNAIIQMITTLTAEVLTKILQNAVGGLMDALSEVYINSPIGNFIKDTLNVLDFLEDANLIKIEGKYKNIVDGITTLDDFLSDLSGSVFGEFYDLFNYEWIFNGYLSKKLAEIQKIRENVIRDIRINNENKLCDPDIPEPEIIIPTPSIIDPSGYVYEAVPSNRVEGVKVEAYYYDYPLDDFGMPMEEKEEILWDAAEYDQVNPLYTDINGQYAWDVPPGQWLVKYSKDGYYDTDSRNDIAVDEDGYLPVPPPQVEVNTAIVSKAAPEVKSVNIYGDSVQIIFSQYMKPATVNSNTVKVVCNGKAVTGTVTASNAEYNYEGTEQFASVYTFTPESTLTGTVSVTVDGAVNYADRKMTVKYSTSDTAEVKPEKFNVPESTTIEYNSGSLAEISVYPAEAGANKALTVTTSSPSIVGVVNSTVITDADGKANIMLQGNLPGSAVITVSLDGTDISAEFSASVGNVQSSENKCEKVTANIPTGSAVAPGTAVTLSTATEGAEIYYTLDGTCPCIVDSPSRILYTGPVTVTEDMFIIAYAVKDGMSESATSGFVYTIDSEAPCAHSHLKKHSEVAPTCTENGLCAYYECKNCGIKFADEKAKIEITDVTLKATGHTAVTIKAVPATCTKTGLTEGKKCSVCSKVITAQKTVAKKAHSNKTVTTKATLSKNGKTEIKCSVCGYVSKTTTIYKIKSVKLSDTAFTYNGKTKTPSVTIKNSKGTKLKSGTDYTVTYPKKRKSIGKYTVTVTFKGNYSGSKKLTFEIVPAKVSLSKLTAGKKQLTATWKTVSGVTGYEVQYSTSKKFTKKTTKTVTVKKAKSKKTTIKKLKKGKKYYVKVRAYKTVSGKKLYGAWSTVKNVKVK